MNVPPPVATTAWRSGSSRRENLALGAAEVGLAVSGEDVGDGQPLARLDQLVDVLGAPAEPRRPGSAHRRLARGHEADEIDLVDRHRAAREPLELVEEARVRDGDRVGAGD